VIERQRPSPPAEGIWRVHPIPDNLPRFARPDPPDNEKPISRFDDPDLKYRVRYGATNLRGALIEVLQQYRINQAAEEAIASVGVDQGRHDDLADLHGGPLDEPALIPLDELELRRIVRITIDYSLPFFDAWDPTRWATLERRPRVRTALDQLTKAVRALDPTAAPYDRLTIATITLSGDLGRPVTQAISREVWETNPRPSGLRYFSQFEPAEECWAVFDSTPVAFGPTMSLDPFDADHAAAVCGAAELHKLRVPAPWSCPPGNDR
jgi:hypothetical protein